MHTCSGLQQQQQQQRQQQQRQQQEPALDPHLGTSSTMQLAAVAIIFPGLMMCAGGHRPNQAHQVHVRPAGGRGQWTGGAFLRRWLWSPCLLLLSRFC